MPGYRPATGWSEALEAITRPLEALHGPLMSTSGHPPVLRRSLSVTFEDGTSTTLTNPPRGGLPLFNALRRVEAQRGLEVVGRTPPTDRLVERVRLVFANGHVEILERDFGNNPWISLNDLDQARELGIAKPGDPRSCPTTSGQGLPRAVSDGLPRAVSEGEPSIVDHLDPTTE